MEFSPSEVKNEAELIGYYAYAHNGYCVGTVLSIPMTGCYHIKALNSTLVFLHYTTGILKFSSTYLKEPIVQESIKEKIKNTNEDAEFAFFKAINNMLFAYANQLVIDTDKKLYLASSNIEDLIGTMAWYYHKKLGIVYKFAKNDIEVHIMDQPGQIRTQPYNYITHFTHPTKEDLNIQIKNDQIWAEKQKKHQLSILEPIHKIAEEVKKPQNVFLGHHEFKYLEI